MPTPRTIEDDYEFRVKEIFAKLRQSHADEEGDDTFDEWLTRQCKGNDVAKAFIDDVESYMGIPDAEDDE